MNRYTIITGTITYAIKGRDMLRRKGYNVKIERITSRKNVGCGYSIILSGGDIKEAEKLLKNAGVKILDIEEIN